MQVIEKQEPETTAAKEAAKESDAQGPRRTALQRSTPEEEAVFPQRHTAVFFRSAFDFVQDVLFARGIPL